MTRTLHCRVIPFLWSVLKVLQPDFLPDGDILLEYALYLVRTLVLLSGVNNGLQAIDLKLEDIYMLGRIAFSAGMWLYHALVIHVNTKLHSITRHAKQHIRMFGCARRGDTYKNETRHKSTKEAYFGTNRHRKAIAPYLITVRSDSENI